MIGDNWGAKMQIMIKKCENFGYNLLLKDKYKKAA